MIPWIMIVMLAFWDYGSRLLSKQHFSVEKAFSTYLGARNKHSNRFAELSYRLMYKGHPLVADVAKLGITTMHSLDLLPFNRPCCYEPSCRSSYWAATPSTRFRAVTWAPLPDTLFTYHHSHSTPPPSCQCVVHRSVPLCPILEESLARKWCCPHTSPLSHKSAALSLQLIKEPSHLKGLDTSRCSLSAPE